MKSTAFIPGLELSRSFYFEAVAPLLSEFDRDLVYSAAAIGYGSDVLGFDTPTSMDHNWGPRCTLFVDDADAAPEIAEYLNEELPPEFGGFPTNFSVPGSDNTRRMEAHRGGNVNHLIGIYPVEGYFVSALGAHPNKATLDMWLETPEQILLELTAGEVFYDGLGKLDEFRKVLAYYPPDVQKLRLAAYWDCVANEEAFVGRMAETGDFIGASLIAARIVTWLMKICFALRRTYCPYSKWFAAGFRNLGLQEIQQDAETVLRASDPINIEEALAPLYTKVIDLQNSSGILPTIDNTITDYYSRPYKVVMAGEIVDKIVESIEDPAVRKIPLLLVALDGKVNSLDFTESCALHGKIVSG